MTDNIYVYLIDMPVSISEAVTPCCDGFTIYLNSRLSQAAQEKSFRHAMWHIEHNDFERDDIQEIETAAHEGVRQ